MQPPNPARKRRPWRGAALETKKTGPEKDTLDAESGPARRPRIGGLRQLRCPPGSRWSLEIEGIAVELTPRQLMNPNCVKFERAAAEAGIKWPKIERRRWIDFIDHWRDRVLAAGLSR